MKARKSTGIVLFFLAIGVWAAYREPSGLEIVQVTFYGYAKGKGVVYLKNKAITVETGDRIQFSEYNPLDGLTPNIMDIESHVTNHDRKLLKDVQVRMAISPKVASLVFLEGLVGSGHDPSTSDHKATLKTAEWFAPILLLQKTIDQLPAGANVKVVFEKIHLKSIIDGYVSRKLWPTELRVDVSIEPQENERSLQDNTLTRYILIKLPPY